MHALTAVDEDYARAIHELCSESGKEVATTSELAARLGVSAPTVSERLRRLERLRLLHRRAYKGVQLTAEGESLAVRVIRRRWLVELFLARTLAMPADEINKEAESLEHCVSDRLAERIDKFLQHC